MFQVFCECLDRSRVLERRFLCCPVRVLCFYYKTTVLSVIFVVVGVPGETRIFVARRVCPGTHRGCTVTTSTSR